MSSYESMIDIQEFSDWLNLQTESGKKCLKNQLQEWTYDEQHLQHLSEKFKRFKKAFDHDPHFYPQCYDLLREISIIEKQLTHLSENDSELEKESYNEILFFKPLLQPLNFIPFFLSFWSVIRIYVLPGISLLLPILTLIAPYIILKFVFNLPITFSNYMSILHSMVSGNLQEAFNPSNAPTWNTVSPSAMLKQFGIIFLTIVQGILQPYWTYKHLKSIDTIIQDHGNLVMRFEILYHKLEDLLSSHGFTFFKCPLPDLSNERSSTARIILQSSYFKLALKYIGSLEVIIQLAHKKEINPVKWVKSKTPIFRIKNTFDFQVKESQRKTITVSFNKERHALLTGPNKGGKSTVLRALSTSALLAHTYGCSFGELISTPFSSIFVCLKPDDLPGAKSRFEREIEFTASTLRHKLPILVFIDELYHSTNPPDALRSCEIYCNQLWKMSNVVSVISTHLFDLVEKSPNTIQRLCCPARLNKDGKIEFMYELNKGICKVSSVDSLLQKNGLCAPEMLTKTPIAR